MKSPNLGLGEDNIWGTVLPPHPRTAPASDYKSGTNISGGSRNSDYGGGGVPLAPLPLPVP